MIRADLTHSMQIIVRAMRRGGATNEEVRVGFQALCEELLLQGVHGRFVAEIVWLTIERALVKSVGSEVEAEIASDKLVGLG
jgi:hypothetical protein